MHPIACNLGEDAEIDAVATSDEVARQLHEYLLREASVPYLHMLHQWITKGVIRDPYQEFMVVFNPKVSPAGESLDISFTGN